MISKVYERPGYNYGRNGVGYAGDGGYGDGGGGGMQKTYNYHKIRKLMLKDRNQVMVVVCRCDGSGIQKRNPQLNQKTYTKRQEKTYYKRRCSVTKKLRYTKLCDT